MTITRIMAVLATAALLTVTVTSAQARVHKAKHQKTERVIRDVTPRFASGCEYDNNGRTICGHAVQRYSEAPRRSRTASRSKGAVDANANRASPHRATASSRFGICPGCVVVPTAANIDITIHASAATKVQGLIGSLVAQGHRPKFITCFARGHKPGSNHGIGMACDIDQTAWNRTSGYMYRAGAAIRSAGLYDGCSFGDCGHIEAVRGLHNKAPNLYASMEKFKTAQATMAYQP